MGDAVLLHLEATGQSQPGDAEHDVRARDLDLAGGRPGVERQGEGAAQRHPGHVQGDGDAQAADHPTGADRELAVAVADAYDGVRVRPDAHGQVGEPEHEGRGRLADTEVGGEGEPAERDPQAADRHVEVGPARQVEEEVLAVDGELLVHGRRALVEVEADLVDGGRDSGAEVEGRAGGDVTGETTGRGVAAEQQRGVRRSATGRCRRRASRAGVAHEQLDVGGGDPQAGAVVGGADQRVRAGGRSLLDGQDALEADEPAEAELDRR